MDLSNRNTALASALVEELGRCGVRQAVICPGSRSTPVALALFREPGIETTTIVDERSAGFFAVGAAQASRKPVVIVCTSGTAAANLHPAVCEADEGRVSLIVLTCDRPPELRAVGAGQTIDQIKLYGAAVRWFSEVGTHDGDDTGLLHLRGVACRAYAEARGERRPGPVHLNLSWRDPLGPEARDDEVRATSPLALGGRGELPLTDVFRPADVLSGPAITSLAENLAETERGLIVAGRQTDPGLAPAVAELSAATGYPIFAEPTSQIRMGGHDRRALITAYDAIARARPAGLDPDLIVRFGDLPTSKALREWIGSLDSAAQLVVDPDVSWNDEGRKAGLILRCEPAPLASSLARAVSGRDAGSSWLATWQLVDEAASSAIAAGIGSGREVTEPAVFRALTSALADGDNVYTASSMPIRDQEAFLGTAPAQVRFYANRGANGIDGLISSAAGAAAATGRPTWALVGDLGLHHDANGLAALRSVNAPVRIVCLNNDGGGIFEFLPQADQVSREEFEALFGTPIGVNPERLAALHDIPYVRISSPEQVAGLPEGHVLAEVAVDRRSNVESHERLRDLAAEAIRTAVAAVSSG